MEHLKAQFCHNVDCTNDKEKSLCPYKCNKGNQFDYECNNIYFVQALVLNIYLISFLLFENRRRNQEKENFKLGFDD